MADKDTYPVDGSKALPENTLVIAPTWQDPVTKALYVHRDMVQVQAPWDEQQHIDAHIAPMKADERFGDVQSWVEYVRYYGDGGEAFLAWNAQGLWAVLDYANPLSTLPGRRGWKASYPFLKSLQWQSWMRLANGAPLGQKLLVEQLEDLGADIVEPDASTLANLLRNLRASVNAKAETELRPDGSSSVSFSKDSQVKTLGEVALPATFKISIPVLKGHTDDEGKLKLYGILIRMRLSIDDDSRLVFRLSIPDAERALELAYADRVSKAQELLGDSFKLLRAAD